MTGNLEILLNGQQFKKIYEKKYNQILKNYRLSKLEIEILLFLDNNKPCDTAKDIVGLRLFAKSHVSKAIASLIDYGYVIAKPDEQDRRCIHLSLSDNAKEVIKDAKEIRNNIKEILFNGISPEEKRTMETVAEKMAYNIKKNLESIEK